jgi:hypothetical protein
MAADPKLLHHLLNCCTVNIRQELLCTYDMMMDGFTVGQIAKVCLTYLSKRISNTLVRNYPQIFLDTSPVKHRRDNPLAPYAILQWTAIS